MGAETKACRCKDSILPYNRTSHTMRWQWHSGAHQMENERMVEFSHAQFVSYPSELAWLESLWRRSQGGVNDESACPGGKKSTKEVEKKREGDDAALSAYKLEKDSIPQNFNASPQKRSLCRENAAQHVTQPLKQQLKGPFLRSWRWRCLQHFIPPPWQNIHERDREGKPQR